MRTTGPPPAASDFFRGLPAEKEAFLALARRREVKKYGFVFLENDPARS